MVILHSLKGGISFVGLKGIFKIYYKQQQYLRQAHRQIKNFDQNQQPASSQSNRPIYQSVLNNHNQTGPNTSNGINATNYGSMNVNRRMPRQEQARAVAPAAASNYLINGETHASFMTQDSVDFSSPTSPLNPNISMQNESSSAHQSSFFSANQSASDPLSTNLAPSPSARNGHSQPQLYQLIRASSDSMDQETMASLSSSSASSSS